MSEVRDLFSTSYGKTITPHDTTNIGFTTRMVHVAVAGDVSVVWADGGTTEVLTGITAGNHPWRITRVNLTGTSATGITAFR